jgi:predicted dehydrogenase
MQIGIIGCGAIAEYHLRAANKQPGCRVVACADVDIEKARRFAAQFEVPRVFSDGDSMLQLPGLDVVVICTPPKWHADLLLSALQLGKHVLVEKPLATTLEEADAMVVAAAQTNRIVAAALMHRYLPAYHAARDLIAAGALGLPRQFRLSLGKSMLEDSRFALPGVDSRRWLVDCEIAGGGILMSSSIHFLSVASYVLGDPIALSVAGDVRQLHPAAFPRIEDDIDLLVQWENGVEFKHHESWVADLPYQAEIIGEEGRLSINGSDFTNLVIRIDCQHPLPAPYHTAGRNQPLTNLLKAHEQSRTLFVGLWADLVESIRQGTPLARLPDVHHARNMQAIIAACYQAASTGEATPVSWMPKESLLTS